MAASRKKKLFKVRFFVSILLLLITVVFLQKQADIRSRAGINSIQVQCSQYPTVDLAFSFTNTESYAVDLIARFSANASDPIAEINNIPPGETRNGIVDTGKPLLGDGNLIVTWTPSEQGSSQAPKTSSTPYSGKKCADPQGAPTPVPLPPDAVPSPTCLGFCPDPDAGSGEAPADDPSTDNPSGDDPSASDPSTDNPSGEDPSGGDLPGDVSGDPAPGEGAPSEGSPNTPSSGGLLWLIIALLKLLLALLGLGGQS